MDIISTFYAAVAVHYGFSKLSLLLVICGYVFGLGVANSIDVKLLTIFRKSSDAPKWFFFIVDHTIFLPIMLIIAPSIVQHLKWGYGPLNYFLLSFVIIVFGVSVVDVAHKTVVDKGVKMLVAAINELGSDKK